MTNLDRWQFMTKDLGCPDNYLTFAFYAGISIALERRVFYGDLNRPLFVNNYTLFIGRSGIGKGQAMREIKRIVSAIPAVDKAGQVVVHPKTLQPKPMFQTLADTLTFEQMIAEMSKGKKSVHRPNNEGIYESAPFYVCLEELSSMLRLNKDEAVARLLLNLYDSSEPYRYDTKKSGSYEIKSGCLNLLAGTTVDFLTRAEKAGLVGEGLMSRMLPVYADYRPEDAFEQNVMSAEQLEYQDELRKYVFRLAHIFGPLKYSERTATAMEDWWQSEQKHLAQYADEKLSNYFSRRKVQVMKLAAAIELSETVTFEISYTSFQKAAALIRSLEAGTIQLARRSGNNMHFKAVEGFIAELTRRKEMTMVEVISWLSPDLELPVLMSTLAILKENGRIYQTPKNTWIIPSSAPMLLSLAPTIPTVATSIALPTQQPSVLSQAPSSLPSTTLFATKPLAPEELARISAHLKSTPAQFSDSRPANQTLPDLP